jgi:thioredoxin-like negative regulator of GroEL
MAGQCPPISLAALSKQVSDAISYNIHDFLDEHAIGQAVLQTVWNDDDDLETFGGYLASEKAEKAVEEAVGDTCNDEAIAEAVTKVLQDAGFTNDPPALEAKKTEEPVASAAAIKAAVAADLKPQPSVAMDVTALREQTLGSLLPSSSPTASRTSTHQLSARVCPQT